MPRYQEGVAVLWRWCRKNRVWNSRTCGHARCERANVTKFTATRPIDYPDENADERPPVPCASPTGSWPRFEDVATYGQHRNH